MPLGPPPTPPLWVRLFTGPLWLRCTVVGVAVLGYFAAWFLVDEPHRFSLRPVNLALVTLAGLCFGMRGGLGVGALLAVLNTALYVRGGIFAGQPGAVEGNVLSIVIGVALGGVVGKARDLAVALRAEVERRTAAERRKEELTELLIHDLKNPLAGIIGYGELLRAGALTPDETREGAATVYDAAHKMRRMVMNLLDIGRAEDGQLTPRREDVDVAALADELKATVARQAADRRLTLQTRELSPSTHVDADPDLLRRLLLNLLDNAMKYTAPGGTVTLEYGAQDGYVELAVRDEGPGIPRGYEERIFDKYARLERDQRIAATVSRGLGLVFCRMAAQAHGGRIWVEPSPPKGSAFRVRLPRSVVHRLPPLSEPS